MFWVLPILGLDRLIFREGEAGLRFALMEDGETRKDSYREYWESGFKTCRLLMPLRLTDEVSLHIT